jgi:membrane-bound lytic murein transglycosylase A
LKRFFWRLSVTAAFFGGCRTLPPAPVVPAPTPVPVCEAPLAPVPAPPAATKLTALVRLTTNENLDFSDDASTESLKRAALRSAAYFRTLPASQTYQLAADTYTAADMAASLEFLASILDSPERNALIKDAFIVYQSVGKDAARNITFSSYYEPTIAARLAPDAQYRYPLYGRPKDLVDVDLGLFDAAWQGGRIAGRRDGQRLVPYYTREDIDALGALKGQGAEIAWAKDPMDIFFLQVEGSGWLDLGLGQTVRVRFDGHNGRKYGSVGQYVLQSGRMKKEGFTHAAFVRYMREHAQERQKLLDIDARYVFFRLDKSSAAVDAYGNIGVGLTPGRSVATDPKLFPKGMLAWVSIEGKAPIQRFVLNQDEGGAIQGPARVDFFAGHGKDAEGFAFQLWNPGKLYFLMLKPGRQPHLQHNADSPAEG